LRASLILTSAAASINYSPTIPIYLEKVLRRRRFRRLEIVTKIKEKKKKEIPLVLR